MGIGAGVGVGQGLGVGVDWGTMRVKRAANKAQREGGGADRYRRATAAELLLLREDPRAVAALSLALGGGSLAAAAWRRLLGGGSLAVAAKNSPVWRIRSQC